MKETKKYRTNRFYFLLNEDEEKTFTKYYERSTSNSISEYVRDVMLRRPVNILYRNKSADDFLEEMIVLKNELNAIGKNFDLAVHKLQTLDHIPEIKNWAVLNESARNSLMQNAEEIKEKLNQIYQLWLQE